MEILQFAQLLAGSVLFAATAFLLQRALLDSKAQWPERVALGVVSSFLVPGLLLLLLNLSVRFPINTLTVYAAFIAVSGAALAKPRLMSLASKRFA